MDKPKFGQPIEILLVEDNPGDARLAEEALHESKILNNLHHVADGEEALDFLHKRGAYQDAPRPDLILLDLNLPRRDGREVLQEVKHHETLKVIPVVVFTISQEEEDILRSYGLHANCFITKPLDLEQFGRAVQAVANFWFTIVTLPPRDGGG